MRGTGEGLPNTWRGATGVFRAAPQVATALRGWLLALALLLPGPVLAAGFTCAPPPDSGKKDSLDELEEVVITAEQVETDTKDLQAWLRLLVGKYTYEGYVDLCGAGNAQDLRLVTGNSDCIKTGDTPNVQCTVNVRWPTTRGENGAPVLGGSSTLLPAFVIYTLENRHNPEKQLNQWGLMFTQVDNKGVAEWASGTLVGDTFTSKEPCVDILGNCQRVTRITAKPDSDEIAMLVDVRIDDRRVLRQTFLLHRESTGQKGKASGGSSQ
jgi:hypothetical protein